MAYIIIFGVLAVIIFIIAIRRRNSDRSRIRDITGNIDSIGDGIDRADGVNQEIADGIDRAEETTEIIRRHNKSAKDGIKSVKRILERAKKRSDNT